MAMDNPKYRDMQPTLTSKVAAPCRIETRKPIGKPTSYGDHGQPHLGDPSVVTGPQLITVATSARRLSQSRSASGLSVAGGRERDSLRQGYPGWPFRGGALPGAIRSGHQMLVFVGKSTSLGEKDFAFHGWICQSNDSRSTGQRILHLLFMCRNAAKVIRF